ncbi:hypothetical protein B9Z55_012022 [Caenorhabditis nigoni]|uniref:Uncharacterized protein n=1 Tax=Caenorhabditis nigoni TaxID=1611254 RepID=A0A2G5TVC9_9PELO|nr:hypothetical protein B9Z55_012022 [Caenorhabditis nigoni]
MVMLPKNNTNQTGVRKKSNHQGRFLLKNINEARRILASGLINNIASVFMIPFPKLGPASNMYRMKWSRQLEELAEKRVSEINFDPSNLYGKINFEGFRGFYWLHDFSGVVEKFLKKVGLDNFVDIKGLLEGLKTPLDTLMLIIWAFAKIVAEFPNINFDIGDDSGPLELFFADRYDFGCSFDVYAVCFVRDGQRKQLYKRGVPCTECPTFCEFTENIDGTIDEGDMCVPPTTTKLAPAPMPEFEFDSAFGLNYFMCFIFISVHFLING